MTVLSPSAEVLEPTTDETFSSSPADVPEWFEKNYESFGERLSIPEWEDKRYREKNGWRGTDLVHSDKAPVRMLEYRVEYADGEGINGNDSGGVGTKLVGAAHFTKRAESHKGFCHGGSMCSIMDDIVGWCAFCVTGKCLPWSGFTVQVNTSLKRPIMVNSHLLVVAEIVRIERRKVSIYAKLVDPIGGEELVHATTEGLVVLNRDVLPQES